MKKGTRGISWGPLLTLGPRALPEMVCPPLTVGQAYVLKTKGMYTPHAALHMQIHFGLNL
ncbi:unnamed protein product [Staurois parvus]|uniref:Uncharacterized protein n=1 Tax=Staurois parvus TaxID=386267 RepID=A0ABN9FY25_9NEOB|nr:unnamed protein product [Staurois parvus]